MFHHDSIKNKYGFYQCGDFYTYSKLEAIEKSNATDNSPLWNFNQEVYSQWDWKQNPKTDLWTLYTQRAKQIREQYDYVVLMFSGGADSSNVVDVFLKNNIAVDELCSYHQLAGSKSIDNYMDSEIFKVAYPRTQAILKSHPAIKHRMIDWSHLVQNLLNDPEEIKNFVYTQKKELVKLTSKTKSINYFDFDILILINQHEHKIKASLDFEFICSSCKHSHPIFDTRCPHCHDILTLNVKHHLSKTLFDSIESWNVIKPFVFLIYINLSL
jgi:hypothetical protein